MATVPLSTRRFRAPRVFEDHEPREGGILCGGRFELVAGALMSTIGMTSPIGGLRNLSASSLNDAAVSWNSAVSSLERKRPPDDERLLSYT